MRFIAGLLLSISVSFALAQQQSNESTEQKEVFNYLLFGTGYVHETIYDEAISKLRYQRGGIIPELGFMRVSPKSINRIQVNGSYLNLRSKAHNDLIASRVSSIEGGINYDHLRVIKKFPKECNWYVGGYSDLLFDLKQAPQLDNSSLLYDYALSIGLSSALRKSWQLKKRAPSFLFQLSLPLLAHTSRPPYLNRIEFIDVNNDLLVDFFENSEITSLNGFFNIQTTSEFYYPIREGNALRLSYRWDYYRMKTFNRVFQGEQQLVFSFLMNI